MIHVVKNLMNIFNHIIGVCFYLNKKSRKKITDVYMYITSKVYVLQSISKQETWTKEYIKGP